MQRPRVALQARPSGHQHAGSGCHATATTTLELRYSKFVGAALQTDATARAAIQRGRRSCDAARPPELRCSSSRCQSCDAADASPPELRCSSRRRRRSCDAAFLDAAGAAMQRSSTPPELQCNGPRCHQRNPMTNLCRRLAAPCVLLCSSTSGETRVAA